jgi:hypothetical protein
LGEEGDNVQPHKDLGELDTLDAPDLLLGHEEIDHATEDHIVESVYPHGSQQQEDLRGRGQSGGLLIPRAGHSKAETGELPRCAHDDDPAEADPLVEDGLKVVDESCNAEDDGEDESSGEGRVITIVGIAGPFGDISILPGSDGDAGRGGRGRRGGLEVMERLEVEDMMVEA